MNSCKPPETIAMECEFRLSSENSITLNSPHFRRRRSLRRLRSRTTPALAATARTTRPRPRPALPRSPTRTASRSTPMSCPTPRSTRKTPHAPAAAPCIPRRPRKRPPRPSAAAATTRTPTNATPATSCRSVPSEADGSKEFARFRPRLQLRAAIAAAAWFGRLCHRFCMVRATTPISRGTTVQSMRVGASWPSQSAGAMDYASRWPSTARLSRTLGFYKSNSEARAVLQGFSALRPCRTGTSSETDAEGF